MTDHPDLDEPIGNQDDEREHHQSTDDGDHVPSKPPVDSDDVRTFRPSMRKRQMTLTEQERQALLAELAEIAAELDALQERTAEITARVARRSSVRLARPA